jgi:hypothetical protein
MVGIVCIEWRIHLTFKQPDGLNWKSRNQYKNEALSIESDFQIVPIPMKEK